MPTGRDDRAWTFAKAVALLMVAYGVALATFSPSGFPEHQHTGNAWPYVADKPFGEDGFLMLTVGWNLGAGFGPVYNQGRTTTGIQPLSTAIDGVLAAIVQRTGGDKWTLLLVYPVFVGDHLSIMSWFIEHEFPPSVRVGTFNSGIAGFFHENVVNLDGKMNSDALAALRSGTLDEYLAHDRIDVMIDWPEQVALYISPERLREHWTRCAHEVPDSPMACWQRRPAIATTPSAAR